MSEKRRPPPPPLQASRRQHDAVVGAAVSSVSNVTASAAFGTTASNAAHTTTPHKYLTQGNCLQLQEWIQDERIAAADTDTVAQLVQQLSDAGWTTVEGLRCVIVHREPHSTQLACRSP